MAESLAQYIYGIEKQRKQDTAQKIQSFIPYIDSMIAKKQESDAKARKRTDIENYGKSYAQKMGWSEDEYEGFRVASAGIPDEYYLNAFNQSNTNKSLVNEITGMGIPLTGNEDAGYLASLSDAANNAAQLGEPYFGKFKAAVEAQQPPNVAYGTVKGQYDSDVMNARLQNSIILKKTLGARAPKSGLGGAAKAKINAKLDNPNKASNRLYFSRSGKTYYYAIEKNDKGQYIFSATGEVITNEYMDSRVFSTASELDEFNKEDATKATPSKITTAPKGNPTYNTGKGISTGGISSARDAD
jgi:hypothetical protein